MDNDDLNNNRELQEYQKSIDASVSYYIPLGSSLLLIVSSVFFYHSLKFASIVLFTIGIILTIAFLFEKYYKLPLKISNLYINYMKRSFAEKEERMIKEFEIRIQLNLEEMELKYKTEINERSDREIFLREQRDRLYKYGIYYADGVKKIKDLISDPRFLTYIKLKESIPHQKEITEFIEPFFEDILNLIVEGFYEFKKVRITAHLKLMTSFGIIDEKKIDKEKGYLNSFVWSSRYVSLDRQRWSIERPMQVIGLIKEALDSNKFRYSNKFEKDKRFKTTDDRIDFHKYYHSGSVIPLIKDEEKWGVLCLDSLESINAFSEKDEGLLITYSQLIMLLLEITNAIFRKENDEN